MGNNFLLTLIAIDWVVAFAYFAPLALVGRATLYKMPKLGIVLWLFLFVVSVLCAALAFGLAAYSVFETWLQIDQRPAGTKQWIEVLVTSFAPWLTLAVAGILVALADQKLEGFFGASRRVTPGLLGGIVVGRFDNYTIIELPLPILYVGSSHKDRAILQTTGASGILTESELSACYQHEAAHLRGRHAPLLGVLNLVRHTLGIFAVTKAMVSEVGLLVELLADSKVADRTALTSALRKIGKMDRELRIRLGE